MVCYAGVLTCPAIVSASSMAGDSSDRHYFALCRSRTEEQRDEERRENLEKHGAGDEEEEEEEAGDTHTFYVDAVCIPLTIAQPHLISPPTSSQLT